MKKPVPYNCKYQEYPPSLDLCEYVDCYWTFSGEIFFKDAFQRIMPTGAFDLIIHYGDLYENVKNNHRSLEPRLALFGPISSANTIFPTGQINIIAIRFKPAGIVPFLSIPAGEFCDEYIPCRELKKISDLFDIESILPNDSSQAIAKIDDFLHTKLNENNRLPDLRVVHAIIALQQAPVSIKNLAKEVNLSTRHFQQLFYDYVGISPKTYSEIIRFNQTLYLLQTRPSQTLTEISYVLNYFDQAHFIKSFKKLSGFTPSEYINRGFGNFIFA